MRKTTVSSSTSLDLRPIRNDAEYAGVRVKTDATIAGAHVPIQADVGLVPGPSHLNLLG